MGKKIVKEGYFGREKNDFKGCKKRCRVVLYLSKDIKWRLKEGSIKTRIETHTHLKQEHNQMCLKEGSIKTRIETIIFFATHSFFSCLKEGSIKTRIETNRVYLR